MRHGAAGLALAVSSAMLLAPAPGFTQFRDDFEGPVVPADPAGVRGWAFFTGDGAATVDFRQGGAGHASIHVDARRDRRGIWWALIRRKVSDAMDLSLLARPGHELRVEARIRTSHAPRRVNLHLNTQRTTDFHSHLMEFDLPGTGGWHTISMTTRDFDAVPGDTVFGQMALMDWGLEEYRVDVDYFKVDLVEAARAGPDRGEAVPYHPPVPDLATFAHTVPVAQDATIDVANPDANLDRWSSRAGDTRVRLLTVSGTQYVVLRFDLRAFAGRRVAGHGLLELTTHSVQRTSDERKDFGLVRVVEVLGGDPAWDQRTVSADSLRQGEPLERVLNPQPIIDYPVADGDGERTHLTISRPVLQRLLDGRTLGIALRPLGSVVASFHAMENAGGRRGARLLFNLE
jgi:hypothetical protein